MRRNKKYSEISWEELKLPANNPSLETHAITMDEFRKAREAMHRLKDPYRDVFIMHAIGGIKLNEIALTY